MPVSNVVSLNAYRLINSLDPHPTIHDVDWSTDKSFGWILLYNECGEECQINQSTFVNKSYPNHKLIWRLKDNSYYFLFQGFARSDSIPDGPHSLFGAKLRAFIYLKENSTSLINIDF